MASAPLPDVPFPSLGKALRILREQRGIKQKELAERAGMGKSQVSLYESGKQAPNPDTLFRLLATLEADFHDLYNALKIADGRPEEACAGKKRQDERAAAEKIAEGLVLLLRASRK